MKTPNKGIISIPIILLSVIIILALVGGGYFWFQNQQNKAGTAAPATPISNLNPTATPGIKITEPLDGAIVVPGEEITVKIEAVEGFEIRQGTVGVASDIVSGIFSNEKTADYFSELPGTFVFKIPKDVVGEIPIIVFGEDKSGKTAGDNIKIISQPQVAIKALKLNDGETSVDVEVGWNDNIKSYHPNFIFSVKGVYSDGVEREITKTGIPITYKSSDPSVASINTKGKIVVHKVGNAQIIVDSSGVSSSIPVVFKQPAGIRPSETIPPAISIDIQPKPNPAGWNNGNITISLAAQDNEGGSGIREIVYSLPYISAESNFVENNQAVIPFSTEGINLFHYVALDREGNDSGQKSLDIKLDKTPPVTTATAPQPNADGWITSLPVQITFTAKDNLSGVAFTTPNATLTKNGEYNLKYYSTDIAGNIESSKTITVKIAASNQ